MRKLLLTALIAFAPACTDVTSVVPAELTGEYVLVTVNAQSLPYLSGVDILGKQMLLADTITLRGDHTVKRAFARKAADSLLGGFITRQDTSGTFALNGPAIAFTSLEHCIGSGVETATGTLIDGQILLVRSGNTFIYERRLP